MEACGDLAEWVMLGAMRLLWRTAGIAALLLAACGNADWTCGPADNPTALRDVTGVNFAWICAKENGCSVGLSPSTPPPEPCSDDMTPAHSYDYERYFHICSVCSNIENLYWTSGAPLCRLVVCETSNDCPIFCWRTVVDLRIPRRPLSKRGYPTVSPQLAQSV